METNSILTRNNKLIMIDGKVYYSDHDRWNSMIRLKKTLLHEFNQLSKKDNSVAYRMELYNNTNDMLNRITELGKEGRLPILLFFYNMLK